MPDISINLSSEAQTPLELVFKNSGAPTTTPEVPHYRSIDLSPASLASTNRLLASAKALNKPIRSDSELNQCILMRGVLDWHVKDCKRLEGQVRVPLVDILNAITGAIEPIRNSLTLASKALRTRIEDWRALVVEGERRETERLAALAEEKRQQAKYADNPAKRKAAKLEADKLEKEARAVAPKPVKGMDTVEYYEFEIVNRVQAARLPEEAVSMSVNESWFNRQIKEKQRAGERISANMWDGIVVTKKTRARFH